MSWLSQLIKESARRRFSIDDMVRYFTEGRKGKGRGIVLTPNFSKGKVTGYDPIKRRYTVLDANDNSTSEVHPRNMMPERLSNPVVTETPVNNQPAIEDDFREVPNIL